jgi:hypothetical protein
MAEETKIVFDAALKAKWVAALRGGDFNQGRGNLRDEDGGYCCLGVFAEAAGFQLNEDGTTIAGKSPDDTYFMFNRILDESKTDKLIQMNDGYGTYEGCPCDFSQIADYIEQNIPTITDGLITSSERQSNEEVVVSNNLASPLSHK